MHRVLAVDWGERRVGVAISDPTGSLARPLPTLEVRSENEALDALARLARDEEAASAIVGHPLHLDGTRGEAAQAAERFADRLRSRTGLPVRLWDERLTSVQAERIAHEIGERTRRNKGLRDRRAAMLLLQSYLDSGAFRRSRT